MRSSGGNRRGVFKKALNKGIASVFPKLGNSGSVRGDLPGGAESLRRRLWKGLRRKAENGSAGSLRTRRDSRFLLLMERLRLWLIVLLMRRFAGVIAPFRRIR